MAFAVSGHIFIFETLNVITGILMHLPVSGCCKIFLQEITIQTDKISAISADIKVYSLCQRYDNCQNLLIQTIILPIALIFSIISSMKFYRELLQWGTSGTLMRLAKRLQNMRTRHQDPNK